MNVPGSALKASFSRRSPSAGCAGDGERLLEREHGLDDGAELGAVRGVAAGEVLVAGEHAVGQAVTAVELGEHFEHGVAIGLRAGDERPDGAGLDGLAVVDAVGGEREVLEAAAFVELDELGGDGLGELEIGVLRDPVVALLVEQAGEIEEIRRAGAVVEPEDAERCILPAELAPVAQRDARAARRADGGSSGP